MHNAITYVLSINIDKTNKYSILSISYYNDRNNIKFEEVINYEYTFN